MNKAISRVLKQFTKRAVGVLFATGLLVGSMLAGNVQPVAAAGLSTQVATGGLTVLANAGGRELRNSVDDKMATEYGNKIDVNNTNIAAFRKYRGLYPTIAGKVVSNAPYDSVEDILEIPGLRQVEKDRIQQNMDVFTISDPDPALVEGADRFNNGVYK